MTVELPLPAQLSQSRLWPGLEPYSGEWRAALPQPGTLPHYPVISARGGFPDGN